MSNLCGSVSLPVPRVSPGAALGEGQPQRGTDVHDTDLFPACCGVLIGLPRGRFLAERSLITDSGKAGSMC